MQIKWEKNQKDWDSFVGNVETGRENIKMYQTFVTDYHKRDLDREYVKEIKSFNIEDIVKMHIDFVYDTTKYTIATVE
jgi:hypothetical protein